MEAEPKPWVSFETLREVRNALRRIGKRVMWSERIDGALDRAYDAFWVKTGRDTRVCKPPEGFATEMCIAFADQAGANDEDLKAIGRILKAAARRNEKEFGRAA